MASARNDQVLIRRLRFPQTVASDSFALSQATRAAYASNGPAWDSPTFVVQNAARTICVVMDDFLLRIFQYEVVSQCEFGLRAASDLDAALKDSERRFEELRQPRQIPTVRYKTVTLEDIPPGSVLSDRTLEEIKAGRFQLPIYEPVDIEAAKAEALERVREAARPTTDIWYAIQNLLIAAGNLSKLLWGAGNAEANRKPWRDSLGVTDDSVLRDRGLRNHFEHFDEKLEAWYKVSERRNFVGRNIGPQNMIQGLDEAERFHHFDPSTGLVTFWAQSLSLPKIVAEIARILPVARSESMKW